MRPSKHSHDELGKRIAALFQTVPDVSRVWIESPYQLAPRQWLQPDVSVTWPDQRVENDYKQGGAMIAVEISSGANTDEEMERKRLAYLDNGTGEVWIIYPKTCTMLVCRRDRTRHVDASETYRSEIIASAVAPEYHGNCTIVPLGYARGSEAAAASSRSRGCRMP